MNDRIPRSSHWSNGLPTVAGEVAKGLEINAEVLATRRELEKLAAGKRDVSLLRGWRSEIVGERLLAAL